MSSKINKTRSPLSTESAISADVDEDIAIRVINLSKCYHIYDRPRDRLLQMLMRGRKQFYREFWALKDISFEVKKGETVGIVGRNGSGKSTLLQLICGTLNPTSGNIQTNGRIAALLELGSGFNPEFTGCENVYMNAAILGLSKEETAARYSDIAAFADIGEFINQPVKAYSSGMVVRLAFAVAINVDPQILIIDEALSVGDELFQRKCFSRIETIKNSGATILFVSHSGATVVELCDRAILLDGGALLTSGLPKIIVGKYQKLLYAPEDKREGVRNEIKAGPSTGRSVGTEEKTDVEPVTTSISAELQILEEFFDPHLKPQSTISYESQGATIEPPQILNFAGEPVNCLKRGRIYRYTYTVLFDTGASSVRFGMLIKTLSGIELGGAASARSIQEAIPYVAPGSAMQVTFRFQCNLNPGTYFLNAGVMGARNMEETYLHRVLDSCMFRVLPCSDDLATGLVDFQCAPDIVLLPEKSHQITA